MTKDACSPKLPFPLRIKGLLLPKESHCLNPHFFLPPFFWTFKDIFSIVSFAVLAFGKDSSEGKRDIGLQLWLRKGKGDTRF